MALTTENRRRIAQGSVLPVADSTISAEDRAGVLGYLFFAKVPSTISPGFDDTDRADYHPLAKWRIDSWEVGTSLKLTLRDLKTRLKSVVASDVFTGEDYPNANAATLGSTIPIIYGTVRGATAYLIDSETSTFKVADHEITALTVYSDGAVVVPDSTDFANGEFVWTGYDGEEMTADVKTALSNPADVIYDLLTVYGGETSDTVFQPGSGHDREGQGFGTFGSRTHFILGHDKNGVEVNAPTLSIYINEEKNILDMIGIIEKFAMCDLYTGTDGLITLVPWEPLRGQDITYQFAKHEIFNAERGDETSDTVTRAVVKYRKQHANDTTQVHVAENEEGRLLRGLPSHITEEVDAPFSERRDAQQWGSRFTFMRSKPVETWGLDVTPKAWFLTPGNTVSLTYPQRNLDGLFEVLTVEFTPGKGPVKLLVGNRRGFGDTVGFYSIDAPTFPADLGGGSAETWSAGWTVEQKKWARENIMYLTDDNELAEATDVQSFRPGSFT